MRTLGWFLYVVVMIGCFCFISARCTRYIEPAEYGVDAEPAVNFNEPAFVDDAMSAEAFVPCAAGEWQLACPAGWVVSYKEDGGVTRITVANTDKQIVRGAVLPDDYFEPKGDSIMPDANKYATEYVLITIDVYANSFEVDLFEWFEKIHPGAVGDLAPYQVPYQEGLEAVRPKTVQAVIDGEPRFLTRTTGRVYDVALYFRGVSEDEANIWFNEFLRRFPF